MWTVYESHSLDLAQAREGKAHHFDSYERACAFARKVMSLHPDYNCRCVSISQLNDYAIAIDFGSWSDFLVIEGSRPIDASKF